MVYVWPFIPMRRYGTNIIISWKRLANSYRELHIQIDKISKNGNVCRFLLPWLNEIIVKFCFGSTCMHKANYHHIVIFDYFAIFYRSFSICTKLNSCWVWVLWVYYSWYRRRNLKSVFFKKVLGKIERPRNLQKWPPCLCLCGAKHGGSFLQISGSFDFTKYFL